MRLIFKILFFICSTKATAESTLSLSIFSCKTESSERDISIHFFKNGDFYKSILLNIYNRFDTTLNIEKGSYILKFNNIYNQQVTDTLVVTKDTLYWKSLCFDDYLLSRDLFESYTDSLQNNDHFFIDFESYGCFHWEKQRLKVFTKNSNYFATLYPLKKLRENITEKTRTKTVMLTTSQVNQIKNFQYDTFLNATGHPGSTEITYYTFKYKKENIRFVDSQESRERFYNLLKQLLLKRV